MKKSVVLSTCALALISSASASAATCIDPRRGDLFCSRGERLTNLGCDALDTVRCASVAEIYRDKEHLHFAKILNSLTGEINPDLGEGSIVAGIERGSGRLIAVYEPLDGGYVPGALLLVRDSGGLPVIPMRSMHEIRDRRLRAELQRILNTTMGVSGRAAWYEIND